jgi:hypothetical protein
LCFFEELAEQLRPIHLVVGKFATPSSIRSVDYPAGHYCYLVFGGSKILLPPFSPNRLGQRPLILDTSTLKMSPLDLPSGRFVPSDDDRFIIIVTATDVAVVDQDLHVRKIPLRLLPSEFDAEECQIAGDYLLVSGTPKDDSNVVLRNVVVDIDKCLVVASSDAAGMPSPDQKLFPCPIGKNLFACDLGHCVLGVCELPTGRILYKVGLPQPGENAESYLHNWVYPLVQGSYIEDTRRVVFVDEGVGKNEGTVTVTTREVETGKVSGGATIRGGEFRRAGIIKCDSQWCVYVATHTGESQDEIRIYSVDKMNQIITLDLPTGTAKFELTAGSLVVVNGQELKVYSLAGLLAQSK